MRSRPDTLVLGAGGVVGAAWMAGVLAGIEDGAGVEFSRCEHFLGTSAGSIIVARLAAGRPLRRPGDGGARAAVDDGARAMVDDVARGGQTPTSGSPVARTLRTVGSWSLALSSPLVPIGLRLAEPGGSAARRLAFRAVPRPTGSLDPVRSALSVPESRFDGRLRVAAVDRASGRRVIFGKPGSPPALVRDAVAASCAVPWIFTPVTIEGREYVDGGVWSMTNLDAAPAGRGTQVLCLNPIAGIAGNHLLIALTRGSSRSVVAVETQALRARGAW